MNVQNLPLSRIIFVDVETVPEFSNFSDLNEGKQDLWIKKSIRLRPDEYFSPEEKYEEMAGIFAEFGKIVCISMGLAHKSEDGWSVRMKSIYGHDEKELLQEFKEVLTQALKSKSYEFICGHNIREFDIPYLCRRMLVHGIKIPQAMQIAGKKPWELKHFMDTMELWKFGDFKNYTSLNLLMNLFDLPSPKNDIDGSQVGKTYWKENDLERIVRYCERDVLAVIQLLFKWNEENYISDENVKFTFPDNS